MGLITRDFYKSGSHNAISDRSGQKYKRSDMRIEWNGSLAVVAFMCIGDLAFHCSTLLCEPNHSHTPHRFAVVLI